MSEVKATEEAAGNTKFLSISRRSVNNLPRFLVVVYLETLANLGYEQEQCNPPRPVSHLYLMEGQA